MKKLLLVSLVPIFVVTFVLPVFAGPEESLQIQVSTFLVSISLSEDTIDFGTLDLGEEKEAPVFPAVINNGSVAVDLDMKGTDAIHGGNTWTLFDVGNGDDRYMLMISKTSNWDTGVLNLSTDYQEFLYGPSFIPGTDQTFHVKILMPETTSAYGDYTANIYVLATEATP